MSVVAFDIETDGLFDGDTPPAITCCATRLVADGGHHLRTFHSNYAAAMTAATMVDVVEYLYALHRTGTTIVTFNGGGFDFKVLHAHLREDPKMHVMVSTLAREHVDLMFEFVCRYGYYASMNSFASGSGLTEKTGSGADAIGMWVGSTANMASRAAVLAYCGNDVRCLAELYAHVVKCGGTVQRTTKRGHVRDVRFACPPITVAAAAKLYRAEPPDNGWLSDPPDVLGALTWAGI